MLINRSPFRSGGVRDPLAHRKSRLQALRCLLERKNDIEGRIESSIRELQRAFETTSKEVKIGLRARAEEVKNYDMPE